MLNAGQHELAAGNWQEASHFNLLDSSIIIVSVRKHYMATAVFRFFAILCVATSIFCTPDAYAMATRLHKITSLKCSEMSLQSKGLVVHIPFADFRVPKEGLEGIGGNNGITFVYYKKGGVVAFSRISIKITKGLGITPETPPEKAAATLLFGPFSTGRLIKKEIGNGQVLYARSSVNMPGFRTIVVFRGKTATLIDVKLPLKCFGEMLKTFQPSR